AVLEIDEALDRRSAIDDDAPLLDLVRSLVAHALARNGSERALTTLAHMLDREADTARALEALQAFPPRPVSALLGPNPSETRIAALAELRLGSAVPTLVEWTRKGSLEVRAASALALSRLSPAGTEELAHFWLARQDLDR